MLKERQKWLGAFRQLLLAATILLLAGCPRADSGSGHMAAGRSSGHGSAKLKAVCTTSMITDAVRVIGGDRLDVYGMMGPGVDPHLYKARDSDVRRLRQADVIFYNGLHLEAKLGEVLERLGASRPVVAVTASIPEGELLLPDNSAGYHDPHVWFDVLLWKSAVEEIGMALAEVDPPCAQDYQRRSAEYLAELDELHAYVLAQANSVPAERRVLVTAHDAFSYFGRRYGFEVLGLQGISTRAEASTEDVRQLVEEIVNRRIPAVFIESSVAERNVRALQEACRARRWEVAIGGELFSDAMGDEGTPEGSYLGMVRHNIDTITRALRGEA